MRCVEVGGGTEAFGALRGVWVCGLVAGVSGALGVGKEPTGDFARFKQCPRSRLE